MKLPKLIDNQIKTLSTVLQEIAINHNHLSIATGYWDILGTLEIIESIKVYKKIRLIIGQEPLYNSYLNKMGLNTNVDEINEKFPDIFFKSDLENIGINNNHEEIRNTAKLLAKMIDEKILEVKIFKKPMLHAKAYIFGNYDSDNAVGIVGSSNLTGAGLTRNAELNSLEDDYRVVTFQPKSQNQENGHLSWFDGYWNHPDALEWSGNFKQLIETSQFGDLTYGPYDVYIKTLMEVYPDELLPPTRLKKDTEDILYSFQNRNAGILINKLKKTKMAILSDSVGLGKTITAGAVIKHYLDENKGKSNIIVIPPAALKQQWVDDLASVLKVDHLDGAYNIISQQDISALEKVYEDYNKEWRKTKNIDLFVIDEAHNLRNKDSKRNQVILKLLQQHPESHVLMVTATPINNALLDIVNLIQLAAKGSISSIPVSYIRPNGTDIERMDFYDALKRIQTLIKKAKTTEEVETILKRVKPTIHEGLKHYLVRSTRQGVETEGGIIDKLGNKKIFPKSNVESINYSYNESTNNKIIEIITKNERISFENINPLKLNLKSLSLLTQQSSHPIDIIKVALNKPENLKEIYGLSEKDTKKIRLYFEEANKSAVVNILQIIYLLGFAPYKPAVYQHKYYGKNIDEIRAFDQLPNDISIQLILHNLLHVTWLKRLESSPYALLLSLKNYKERLEMFSYHLEKGYILSLKDINLLEAHYDGEDIEQAFSDYDKYIEERNRLKKENKNYDELESYGVEKIIANKDVYNIEKLKIDVERDKKILNVLIDLLSVLSTPKNDAKLLELVNHIKSKIIENKYGNKIIVFSFFADTINYLRQNLNSLMLEFIPDFNEKAEYITGQSFNTENIVRRFSPISKKYNVNSMNTELDFLFATDVLSEGQNLQDAGHLINYDLHWNPVRMIQRNGRINRIGSRYSEVLIANMKPTYELELYLNLVSRLEGKINTIKNTVGLDQGVLNTKDENPIDFIEKYYSKGELPDLGDDFLASSDNFVSDLRIFLGTNPKDSIDYRRISGIPKGKWNYLPQITEFKKSYISLVNIKGSTISSKKEFKDALFVEIEEDQNELKAYYIDQTKALQFIKTSVGDNERKVDLIKVDRKKIFARVVAEAKRQAMNTDTTYKLKANKIAALSAILEYLTDGKNIDYKGVIEKGVNKTNVRDDLERILNKANSEVKNLGSLNINTINQFKIIFTEIYESQSEEREIDESELILVYGVLNTF
jgi:ERCC4-related helicase